MPVRAMRQKACLELLFHAAVFRPSPANSICALFPVLELESLSLSRKIAPLAWLVGVRIFLFFSSSLPELRSWVPSSPLHLAQHCQLFRISRGRIEVDDERLRAGAFGPRAMRFRNSVGA